MTRNPICCIPLPLPSSPSLSRLSLFGDVAFTWSCVWPSEGMASTSPSHRCCHTHTMPMCLPEPQSRLVPCERMQLAAIFHTHLCHTLKTPTSSSTSPSPTSNNSLTLTVSAHCHKVLLSPESPSAVGYLSLVIVDDDVIMSLSFFSIVRHHVHLFVEEMRVH
jgi:hypothetical protein